MFITLLALFGCVSSKENGAMIVINLNNEKDELIKPEGSTWVTVPEEIKELGDYNMARWKGNPDEYQGWFIEEIQESLICIEAEFCVEYLSMQLLVQKGLETSLNERIDFSELDNKLKELNFLEYIENDELRMRSKTGNGTIVLNSKFLHINNRMAVSRLKNYYLKFIGDRINEGNYEIDNEFLAMIDENYDLLVPYIYNSDIPIGYAPGGKFIAPSDSLIFIITLNEQLDEKGMLYLTEEQAQFLTEGIKKYEEEYSEILNKKVAIRVRIKMIDLTEKNIFYFMEK